ncbi:hypothetical protein L1987_10084 [Smallanthus sonchifolius]|uniref:Uncharacterized protein n=1 Tax=Smallanthus sonchifolius TaxID=185202 RepID=A0ACB9JR39_9ASTR|nr:hypothetical protein L1987_10084 [Smallanthus sonchifolius]
MACACMRHWSSIRAPTVASATLQKETLNSSVLVLGGTSRIGGSTAIALSKLSPDLRIIIAGRNREKGASMVATLGKNAEFSEFDINDVKSLESALTDVDLVVHAAGPFQQTENCRVLEAAIRAKYILKMVYHCQTSYLDVCDDTSYALRAKSFINEALDAKVPAITTGGIYPGVSNVMAAELVRVAKIENKGEPERLRFYYYTAGTGGAGPTILATSFLLLGEEVIAYNKGEKIKLRPYSGMVNIDFGKGIGKKYVYLLNLPEVTSTHEILGVPTVSARFGTAPFFWNWAMDAMTRFLPSEVLRDRNRVQEMVRLFDPVVRVMDGYAGERVSLREDGRQLTGYSTAAFALAALEGSTQPGVWFPEEPEGIAIEARELLLERAAQGTINFVMHKYHPFLPLCLEFYF